MSWLEVFLYVSVHVLSSTHCMCMRVVAFPAHRQRPSGPDSCGCRGTRCFRPDSSCDPNSKRSLTSVSQQRGPSSPSAQADVHTHANMKTDGGGCVLLLFEGLRTKALERLPTRHHGNNLAGRHILIDWHLRSLFPHMQKKKFLLIELSPIRFAATACASVCENISEVKMKLT